MARARSSRFVSLVVGRSPGALLVHRLVPATVGLPVLVGLLRLEGERAGLYGPTVGVIFMVTFGILGATALLLWTAASLDRIDAERRRVEEALRRSSEQHRTLARNFPDGAIVLFDRELRHLIADGMGLAGAGLSSESMEGRTIWEVFPADVCAVIEPRYRAALAGEDSTFEYGWRHRTYLVRVVPVADEQTREVWGGAVMVHEISSRKRSEEALRESEARLAEAQTIARLGSWEWRIADDSVVWSDELYRIYGLEPGSIELSYVTFLHRVHPHDRQLVEQQVGRALESGERFALEHRIVRSDGAERWVHARGAVLIDDNGVPVVMRGTAQDITERKRAEDERDRLRADLLHAQKLEAVGQLAGGVAHEFNNMLMAINGHSGLLLDRLPTQSPLRHDVEQIIASAARAASLTRQLLAFGRKQLLQPRPLDLNDALETSLKLLRPLIDPRIEVVTVLEPTLPAAVADPAQVEQVLVNLLLNARDAIVEQGTITVTTDVAEINDELARAEAIEPGRYLSLSVTDSGCGMSTETRARIFEPFFTTKDVGKGSGLGLSTVYGIVRQGGGFLTVDSEPDRGTTMTIYLPPAAADAPRPAPASRPASRGRAVVVDDEAAVRHVCAELLGRLGFEVDVAGSGEEALQLLQEQQGPLELLLTDMVMPGVDGQELGREAATFHPLVTVVCMSGYPGGDRINTATGDDELIFLQKPFTPAELEATIRAATSRSLVAPSTAELTCLVADDHPSVLDAVCRALTAANIQPVARVTGAREAIEHARRCTPDVAVIDIKMPGTQGVEAARQIREASPETRVLLYTGDVAYTSIADALAAGAQGVVLKDAPIAELIRAIKIVAAGGIYVDQVFDGILRSDQDTRNGTPNLTPREHDVLRLLADGNTNDQVSKALAISSDTVQTHVRNAMKKLGAETRTQAVATAMRQALIR